MGEAMYLLESASESPLADEKNLVAGVAGAEMNTCIAVARTGLAAWYCSRVGDDPFGRRILSTLTEEGVDPELVTVDASAPTGVFFKEVRPEPDRSVYYYRTGSAASKLSTADAAAALSVAPRSVFASGINLAIGKGPAEATVAMFNEAKRRGLVSYFDPNLRLRLGGASAISDWLWDVLDSVDVVLLGSAEANALFGNSDIRALSELLARRGVTEVVVKKGANGCEWWSEGTVGALSSVLVETVDPVGAGDAFNGGYFAARLAGASPDQAVQLGSLFGGSVVGQRGDFGGLPSGALAGRALELATEGSLIASEFYKNTRASESVR